jgi:hypothetical protein
MSEERPSPTTPTGAGPATGGGTLDDRPPADDWSTYIDAWASTAQSGPMSPTTRRNPA